MGKGLEDLESLWVCGVNLTPSASELRDLGHGKARLRPEIGGEGLQREEESERREGGLLRRENEGRKGLFLDLLVWVVALALSVEAIGVEDLGKAKLSGMSHGFVLALP